MLLYPLKERFELHNSALRFIFRHAFKIPLAMAVNPAETYSTERNAPKMAEHFNDGIRSSRETK